MVFGLVTCVAGVQFDEQQQLQNGDNYYNNYYNAPAAAEESSRTHHKHKLQKKLKKRLLLQCLLEHRRRRRDTDAASGRFLLPVVLQNTNVNVGGQSGYSGEPNYGSFVGGGGGGGCMQMLNNHGPLHGSLGSLQGLLGSTQGLLGSTQDQDSPPEGTSGSRNGMYSDWNRYARQFHRSFVRPLVRLF